MIFAALKFPHAIPRFARLGVAITIAVAASLAPQGCAAAPMTLTKRSTMSFPISAVDQSGQSFPVTGVSGITYLDSRRGFTPPAAGQHAFVAAMNNSNKLIQLNLGFSGDGSITSLFLARGMTLPETHDNEGIACTNAARNSVFICNEDQPGIAEYSLTDFHILSRLTMPPIFASRRSNLGFESVTLQESGRTLYFANEEALAVDGPLSTPQTGTLVRIQRYKMNPNSASQPASFLPHGQFAYRMQPIHGAVINGARSGLSDLVALPNGVVLSLERSFGLGTTLFQTRIYELDFNHATDITGVTSLATASFVTVSKRLLYQGQLNNLEGLCLGPQVSPDSWVVLGILDDGDPITVNQVVSFELKHLIAPAPAPPDPVPLP